MTTPMTWDGYVSAWSRTHEGYDPRHAGPMLRGWLRTAYRLGALLVRFGARPAAVSSAAVACTVLVPVFASMGGNWPALGALCLLVGIGADTVAEALAVLLGRVTRLGLFYRTLVDRLGEACWLIALAVLGAHPGLLVACGALVWLHEYIRARACAIGMRAAGSTTIGDRPTRAWLTLLALVLAVTAAQAVGRDLAAGVVTLVAAGWLTLAVMGLCQLLSIVRKALA